MKWKKSTSKKDVLTVVAKRWNLAVAVMVVGGVSIEK